MPDALAQLRSGPVRHACLDLERALRHLVESRHVAVPPALHPLWLELRRPEELTLGLTRRPSDQAIADFVAVQHLGHLLKIGAPILRMERGGCSLDGE